MTAVEYVLSVISKYKLIPSTNSPAYNAAHQFYPIIQSWAGSYLLNVSFSGSYAKGTGIKGSTDVDLFISLDSGTPGTLKDIYENLYSYLQEKELLPRRQNVSIGIKYNGISMDLVPVRKQSGNTNYHSLFRYKAQSWTQTNIQQHINMISQSGRLDEIRAIKIWRNLHRLDFPSFYLELTVLEALDNRRKNQLSANVFAVLQYLRDTFINARVVDPSNSNNIISEDLTHAEKNIITNTARNSCSQTNWGNIIW